MQTKTKLLFIVTFVLLLFTLANMIYLAYTFKAFSIESDTKKAKLIASVVKDGLTSHMVNGIMEKRGYFLEQISKKDEISALWLVRSENVIKQYGEGFNNEIARDKMDKSVLKKGIMEEEVIEKGNKTLLRVTIPYRATNIGSTNCLSCHDVKVNDTLGVISMEFDTADTKNKSIESILKILGATFVFILIALIFINTYVTPYINLITNIRNGLKKAYNGDFTHKFETSVVGEGRILIDQLNILFSKMQNTFGDIRTDLETFVPHNEAHNEDPLNEAKIIITELSDIYKFKKTIELDATKQIVYSRIIDILENKYNLKHFAFYELNNINHKRELIYITEGETICMPEVDDNTELCRAHRTKTDVISTEFHDLCQACKMQSINYACIPFSINKDHSLVLSISTKSTKELTEINTKLPNIKNYLEAAKPVIESKLLMDALRDTSLRDGMTGLYNRRFLEEIIDKIMSKAKREKQSYSVMMLDVDFFKKVNDTYGHDVGDKVIVEIGKVLQDNVRESDLAIRYGGEEFVVMLGNATQEGALKVAQKIHKAFADLIFEVGDGRTIQKTMSIGISRFPEDANSIWQCIKLADTALYVAKTTGRNKIVEYDLKMSEDENMR